MLAIQHRLATHSEPSLPVYHSHSEAIGSEHVRVSSDGDGEPLDQAYGDDHDVAKSFHGDGTWGTQERLVVEHGSEVPELDGVLCEPMAIGRVLGQVADAL